jgi:hypothetical protein
MAIDIKDRFGAVIYAATASTVKEALEEALAVPQTDFQEAALAGADLTDAVLTGIDLTNADLYNTILTGVDFTDAILTGAVLTGATLPEVTVDVVSEFAIVDGTPDITNYDGSLPGGILKIIVGADLEYNQMNVIPFIAVAEVDGEFLELAITPLLENKVRLSGMGCVVVIKKDVLLSQGRMKAWPSTEVITKHYAEIEITISGFIG